MDNSVALARAYLHVTGDQMEILMTLYTYDATGQATDTLRTTIQSPALVSTGR